MVAAGLDPETIIATLQRHRVRFVVIGGFAVELWDVAVPPTVDIDIAPKATRANLERLAAALNELGAGIRVGSDTVAIGGGVTAELLANVEIINLTTSAGPVDITMRPAGTDGYDDLAERAVVMRYRTVEVPTASLEDVARSKEAAGRAKDIRVLPAIRAHLRRSAR